MANVVNGVSYSHSPGGQDFATRYTITFSDNYATGGETINFNTAGNPNGLEDLSPGDGIPPEGIPDIISASIGGYGVGFVLGSTTPGQFNLEFYSAPGTQLAAGAYPASISGGQVNVEIRRKG